MQIQLHCVLESGSDINEDEMNINSNTVTATIIVFNNNNHNKKLVLNQIISFSFYSLINNHVDIINSNRRMCFNNVRCDFL